MAKAYVKCKICGEQFDRNSEPFVEVSARRYAHKACAEKKELETSQEEKDYEELEKYIKKVFNTKTISAKIRKQIKDFHQEYQYTYSGIQKTLYWWFELKGGSLEKANNGIGIVPFIYQEASDYFYRLYLAKIANDISPEQIKKAKVEEIEIGSPRVKTKPLKFFKFGEEGKR
jgi:hypothetical protein